MGRHYGELGVESERGGLSGSFSLSATPSQCTSSQKEVFFLWGCFQRKSNIQNFGITIHPSFSACASEGGDGTPHGSEGGTVQCGPVSDSERSTSRRQGQGRASLSISNDYLVFICAWALEPLSVSASVCLYAYVMCLCTCLITEKLQSWVDKLSVSLIY